VPFWTRWWRKKFPTPAGNRWYLFKQRIRVHGMVLNQAQG